MSSTPTTPTPTRPAPGAHLARQFLHSHEPFHQYHRAVMDLAGRALADPHALTDLRRFVPAYVHHLHVHHTLEELHLFPALREADPSLNPHVDTLLEHHATLAEQLTGVSAALRELGEGEGLELLVTRLEEMYDHVAAHLEFEEATTVPVITTWADWPFHH